MAYQHGVYTSEVETSIVPAAETTAGLPVVFGTAPVHLASDRAAANRPVLCYSYAEAVAALGYSDDWEKYTLCEVMYSQFSLYNCAPVVFVNVLDPDKHNKKVENAELTMTGNEGTITDPVLTETLVISTGIAGSSTVGTAQIDSAVLDAEGGTVLVEGTDYEAAHDDDGNLLITALEGGAADGVGTLYVSYTALDPDAVDADDIIGGVDVDTGAYTGLETLNQVFPLYGLVPGLVLAPGWSDNSEVASVMVSKASSINSHFQAMVITDVSDLIKKYSDVSAWKNNYNYTNAQEVVCWPRVSNGSKIYHMSTHLLGVMAQTDEDNGDIPYESPSNKTMQIDGTCLADGTEVTLGPDEAAYLNGQGVVTALNFIGGWKSWGNRTACYPSNTDPKDAFIPLRRMFNWHASTFIQTYWVKVDKPINKRLINTIVDSENIRLNGLVAQGVLLGGRVEFLEEENATTDLLDGIITFHTYITPPTPARVIEDTIEYDPDYFSALFE